jgi:putative SOS response-associated peptidase YedK
MCTNYEPSKEVDFEAFSQFPLPDFNYPAETYKDYVAPILHINGGEHLTSPATFGLVPLRKMPPGAKGFDTMNARSETIGQKHSFSGAWNRLQLCLIPCCSFFETSCRTGNIGRWRIGLRSGAPLAIAGLWRSWEDREWPSLSFTMLTVNAENHPLMRRFHKPGVGTRSVVILRPEEYESWLNCRSTDEARAILNPFPADELVSALAPLKPTGEPTLFETY